MKAHIHPDLDYPNMYRVRWPDGEWSDLVNLTRAKDAINVRESIEANALKKSGARRGSAHHQHPHPYRQKARRL